MSDCQYCIHDHAAAEGYPGGCAYFGSAKAWNPGRPKPPSVEQRHAWARQALELRHAEENRARRQALERRELERAKARAVLHEYAEQQRQAQFDASRRALEPLRAEYHAWRETQERARGSSAIRRSGSGTGGGGEVMSEFMRHTGLSTCICAECVLITYGGISRDGDGWPWVWLVGEGRVAVMILTDQPPVRWCGPRQEVAGCISWLDRAGVGLVFDAHEGDDGPLD